MNLTKLNKPCLYCGDTATHKQNEEYLCDFCIGHDPGKPCNDPKCPSKECNGTRIVQDWKKESEK